MTLDCCRLYYAPGSIGGIQSSIVNMYGQNGLEQGVSVDINAQLINELSHNPPPSLLWMNGDICYAVSLLCERLKRHCTSDCCQYDSGAA